MRLEDEYKWYLQQADNPENDPEVQALWRQLAEGLAPRINSEHDQDALW